jgi:thiamine biosynthesis lipoprotein
MRFSHKAMATTFEICILNEDSEHAQEACRAAFEIVDNVEQQLSYFIPTSDVSQVNRLQAGQSVRVGLAAYECVACAKRIHDETAGAFDLTVGALLRERRPWDEAEDVSRGGMLPRQKEGPLHVGMDFIAVDPATFSLAVLSNHVQIDLGGIGKGYAVDQIKVLLDDWGIETALVNAGQSTMCALRAPDGRPGWPMRILDPSNETDVLARLFLQDKAISASAADASNNLLDPYSGFQVDRWLGTWSAAPTALLADALSTAFFVMNEDAVRDYCVSHSGIGAVLITQEDNSPVLTYFGDWKQSSLQIV